MQIKTAVRYHFASTKTDKIIIFKIVRIPDAGKDAEKLDFSYIFSGNTKGYSHIRK